jgi:hypothetical protein
MLLGRCTIWKRCIAFLLLKGYGAFLSYWVHKASQSQMRVKRHVIRHARHGCGMYWSLDQSKETSQTTILCDSFKYVLGLVSCSLEVVWKRGWIIPHRIPSDIEKLYFFCFASLFFHLPDFHQWAGIPESFMDNDDHFFGRSQSGDCQKWRDRPKFIIQVIDIYWPCFCWTRGKPMVKPLWFLLFLGSVFSTAQIYPPLWALDQLRCLWGAAFGNHGEHLEMMGFSMFFRHVP